MNAMNMPGFTAESSLIADAGTYRSNARSREFALSGGGVMPQLRLSAQSDPDLGAYLRCKANGGNELVCRFFGGLPPFTIGGVLF